VFGYDDVAYGDSLGSTGHHVRSQIAFKFGDEIHETTLVDVEWNPTRSGLISPVAVFEEVDLDGAATTRATLHNLSIIKQLELGIGDTITIYRSNMVIPKIDDNLTRSNTLIIPNECPCCGAQTIIKDTDNSQVLMCSNPNCSAKKLAQFTHFVSRNCMNIDGLSEAKLDRLISLDYIENFNDIYALSDHYEELIKIDGWGPKSVKNLLLSIENSRNVKLEHFLNALGIPNIGLSAAKTISKYFKGDIDQLLAAHMDCFEWEILDDFGAVMANSIDDYLLENISMVRELAKEMNFIIEAQEDAVANPFNGKSICVTGKLHHFTRNSINEKIESLGAKAASSVSTKTDYLITNEQSGSSKYKKAVELNIPIITEEEFINMIGG
jgi:DNA ligase (NAD+)